jgi:hypothetical protein
MINTMPPYKRAVAHYAHALYLEMKNQQEGIQAYIYTLDRSISRMSRLKAQQFLPGVIATYLTENRARARLLLPLLVHGDYRSPRRKLRGVLRDTDAAVLTAIAALARHREAP